LGNQGLQDQQAALRWVRNNVLAFGGDPDKVTLFGESAGSQNTCLQVVSPGAAGLFHRAISQSGGCLTAKKTRDQAETEASAFAAAVGCSDAAEPLGCLRSKPVQDLFVNAPVDGGDPNAPGGSRFTGGTPRWEFDPIVDGEVIPDQPRTLVDSDRFAKVPYVLGANFEEGRLFLLAAIPVVTEEAYLSALLRRFGDAAERIAAIYPASAFPTPQDALVRVWGDSRMVCATQDTARRVAARGVATYSYNFSRAIPGLEALGPTHGVEMPYVFGTIAQPGPEDQALSDLMQGYWARFARSGDPNGDGALEWPAFEGARGAVMSFNVESAVEPGFRREQCNLWATIYDAEFQ
jgi:para-nitrobenzyl esterase